MTNPQPTAPSAPEPTPPTEPETPQPDNDGNGGVSPDDLRRELKAARDSLRAERQKAAASDRRLSEFQQAAMSDAERAVEAARAEGRAQAMQEGGTRLAAAELRAALAGRVADVDAAIEFFDMARFVGADGNPDTEAINSAAERLVAMIPQPANGNGKPTAPVVPNGPRSPITIADDDWLRRAAGRA